MHYHKKKFLIIFCFLSLYTTTNTINTAFSKALDSLQPTDNTIKELNANATSYYKSFIQSPAYASARSALKDGGNMLSELGNFTNLTLPKSLGSISHNIFKSGTKALGYKPSWLSNLPNPENPFVQWGTGQVILPILLYAAGWALLKKTQLENKVTTLKTIYSAKIKTTIDTIKKIGKQAEKFELLLINPDDLPDETDKEKASTADTKALLTAAKTALASAKTTEIKNSLNNFSNDTRLLNLNGLEVVKNSLTPIYNTQAYLKALLENLPAASGSSSALSSLDGDIIRIFAANAWQAIAYQWSSSIFGNIVPMTRMASAVITDPLLIKAQSFYYVARPLKSIYNLSSKKASTITHQDVIKFRNDLENIIYFWTHNLAEALYFQATSYLKPQ